MMEEAPCPHAEDITPCKCTNDTLDTLTMDCSAVTDEDQLSQVFSSFPSPTSTSWSSPLPQDPTGWSPWKRHIPTLQRAQRGPRECGGQRTFRKLRHSIFPPVLSQQFIELPHLESFTKLTLLDLGFNNLQEFPNVSSDSLETLHVNNNSLGGPSCGNLRLHTLPLQHLPAGDTASEHTISIPFGSLFWAGIPEGGVPLQNSLRANTDGEVQLTVKFNPAVGGSVFLSMNITTITVNAFPGVSERLELQVNSLTEVQEVVWRPLLEAGVTLW